MNPGELNCRVMLKKETKLPDGQGGYETAYVDRCTVWAKVIPVMAKTKDQYEQLTPEILHRMIIRYHRDVAMTDRIQYGSRMFEQIAPPINDGEKNAYLKLECREVVADETND